MIKPEYIIDQIDSILKGRGKEWPLRGKYWYLFKNEIEFFYDFLINNPKFKVPEISFHIEEKLNTIINKPIFICGNEKSGTTLLTQLFDGHPDIFVLPGDSHLIKKYYQTKSLSIEKEAIYWLTRIINPTGQEPFFPYGKSLFVYQNFINYFIYFFYKEEYPFNALLKSFMLSAGEDKIKNYLFWIEKTPLNELHTNKILKLYSDAVFINITRDPVQNIISLKRLHKIRNRQIGIFQLSLFRLFLYEKTLKNRQKINNYKIIRYEDLIKNTKNIVEEICEFLHIRYSEKMLLPTINGIPATANSMYADKRKSGQIVKNGTSDKLETKFTKKELIILANILSVNKNYRKLLQSGYPKIINYRSVFGGIIAKLTYYIYKFYRYFLK